jgi:hypothetical protein
MMFGRQKYRQLSHLHMHLLLLRLKLLLPSSKSIYHQVLINFRDETGSKIFCSEVDKFIHYIWNKEDLPQQ